MSAELARLAAGLMNEANVADGHGAIDRLAHVVDGEARIQNQWVTRRENRDFSQFQGLIWTKIGQAKPLVQGDSN